jgi:hypothetical protein
MRRRQALAFFFAMSATMTSTAVWPANTVRVAIPSTDRVLAFVCDSDGLAMMVPIPGPSRVENDRAVALIVVFQNAPAEIVTGISQTFEGNPASKVQISTHDQIFKNISSEQPIIISRLNFSYETLPQGVGNELVQMGRLCQKAASQMATNFRGPPGSYWRHDTSVIRLDASGPTRKFVFYEPSAAMNALGARQGFIRFEGRVSSGGYAGKAVLFTEKCGQHSYQVTGKIENNDERVTLTGQAPRFDSKCNEAGKRDMTLVFDFIKPSAQ